MQTNRVKAALRDGQAVSGPIVNEARSIGTVKMMAQAGHDFLFFDMEHAMFDWETMLNLVQASLLCDICPLVRVTDLSYPLVARALDSGAQGIIIPRVETREQVEEAVNFAKYPPLGRRGAGGDARYGYVRRDMRTAVEEANAESMVVVQIESLEGVKQLEAIASVPGLDVVCVGPQDLSISMDLHGEFGHPAFMETLQQIVDVCSRHGVATGMVEREPGAMKRWYEMGMRFLVVNNDGNMLLQSATRDVAAIKEFVKRA
jgi:4-hydroxy-2-oxoheptanedioate aldolase